MKFLYKQKGITLVALVITIVILIILAVISINAIFGENGLITKAQEGKKEHEKAEARERLEVVLADAYVEKKVSNEYTEEEFLRDHLDEYIYDQEPEAEVNGEEISLNGYTFALDRSVPELGDYIGEAGNLPPTIRKIEVTSKTDTSATIEVTAVRAEGATYKYSIKKLDESDESYTQVTEKDENINEFTGLEKMGTYTIYKVKVELIKDRKVVDTEYKEILIGKLEQGLVRFEDGKWEAGKANVKIITDETEYKLQYQVIGNGEKINENNWTEITSGSTIEGLTYEQTVYGRLWNGIDESDPASYMVDDNIKPTITQFEATETTWNSITVTVTASDEQSGLALSETYKYYINSESTPRETSTNNSYTFANLTAETSYTLKVIVTDKAENEETQTITVNTSKKIATNVNELKEGDYIIYPSAKGNLDCRVLYDNTSGYGVQIITSECVGDDIALGRGDITVSGSDEFTKAMNSYNNAISRLNNLAGEYNNSTYSSLARCVGSNPTNPSAQAGMYTPTFGGSYSGKLRDADTNYETDYNKMKVLGIAGSNAIYWLASRYVYSHPNFSDFRVRCVTVSGMIYNGAKLCAVYDDGDSAHEPYIPKYGLRPVFKLKSGIKITGGDGSAESPYTLD